MEILKETISSIKDKKLFNKMPDEVKQGYDTYITSHIKWLSELEASIELSQHFVYMIQKNNLIIGFRYFYFTDKKTACELFAVFIDSTFRKQGLATSLIKESIKDSNQKGVYKFTVRIGNKSSNLPNFYEEYCSTICPPNTITVFSQQLGIKKYRG